MLRTLLRSAVLLPALLAPVPAQVVGKLFDPSSFVGIIRSEAMFFDGQEISIVPISDLTYAPPPCLSVYGGVAEYTRFENAGMPGWSSALPWPVAVYSRSGIRTHTALVQFYSTILALFATDPPQQIRSKWLGQSGIEHEVVTTQQDKETLAAFVKRHTSVVDALKAADPPQKKGP